MAEGNFAYVWDEDAIEKEASLDGMYTIRTSLKQTPEAAEVVSNYKRLSAVECAFRTMKTLSLQARRI